MTHEQPAPDFQFMENDMYTYTQRIVMNVAKVREALRHEPAIRPSFAQAGLRDLVPVIFALFQDGTTTVSGVYDYLKAHDCKFDRESIQFLIDAYEGDKPHHLWERHNLGDYWPNFEALPY